MHAIEVLTIETPGLGDRSYLATDGHHRGARARLTAAVPVLVDICAMTSPLRPYVTPPGEGLSAADRTVKASRGSTGGAITVYETTVDSGPPHHVHTHEDESIYVLEGELVVRCGEETHGAPAGSFVFLPRGVPHRFRSQGGPARVLLLAVPAGIEDYFAEINIAGTDEELRRVQDRYGIHVVPALG